MEYDLLNLPSFHELKAHKLRRTVPAPNSYFFSLKCVNCSSVKRCFSHGHSKVECLKCNRILAVPTGGKLKVDSELARVEGVNSANKKI
jgi:small subunit ribosomal protein S27e